MVRRQPLSAPALLWSPRNKLEAELKAVRWAERKSTFALETGRWASCCFNAGSRFVYSEIQSTREEVFRRRGPRGPRRTTATSQHRTMLSRLLSLGSPQTPRSSPRPTRLPG